MDTTHDAQAKEPKHTMHIGTEGLTQFARDHQGSPMISFAKMDDTRLVLMEGHSTLHRRSLMVRKQKRPVTLRFTSREWEAFVSGVQNREFDNFAEGNASDIIPIRDSKDPNGPILIFTVAQIRPFLAAVRDGKYNL